MKYLEIYFTALFIREGRAFHGENVEKTHENRTFSESFGRSQRNRPSDGTKLGPTGDNRDKIATMLYYRFINLKNSYRNFIETI